MAAGTEAAKPDFAAAAATLRETVKWLATTFAALAAVVVGTGPVSGLAEMPAGPGRTLAFALLLAAFGCICAALWITLRILRPEVMYRSYLLAPAKPPLLKGGDENERLRLRKALDAQAKDVLPHNNPTLDALSAKLADIEDGLSQARALPDKDIREQEVEKGRGKRDKFLATVGGLLPLAMYLRLQQRLQRSLPALFILGILALLSLAAFGIVTHKEKPDKPEQPPVVNNIGCPCEGRQASLAALDPVLFETGKALVSKEGLDAIQRARDELLKSGDVVLLIRAHTDTVAADAVNASLATNRANVVRDLLLKQGGVPASRLYVSPLPKHALPQVTRDSTASKDNRSVRLQLALPATASMPAR